MPQYLTGRANLINSYFDTGEQRGEAGRWESEKAGEVGQGGSSSGLAWAVAEQNTARISLVHSSIMCARAAPTTQVGQWRAACCVAAADPR